MAGPSDIDQLIDHLRSCLVLISGAGTGSGFLIAPDTILTCAHVAGGPGRPVTITWHGQPLPGVVKWGSEPGGGRGITPYPDLAVVEVKLPEGSRQPVVWLDDHRPASSAEFVAVGHAEVFGTSPERNSGRYTHGGEYAEMIRLAGDTVESGMSGGPVLNLETGGVCGITKAARQKGQPAGGVAVLIRALRLIMPPDEYRDLRRRHEAHHRCNRAWFRLAGNGVSESRGEWHLRELLGLLPPIGHAEHLADFRAVIGDPGAEVPHPLLDHGDVVAELAGRAGPADRLPPVLAYALLRARSAGDPLAEQIGQWASMAAHTPEDWERVQAARSGPATTPPVAGLPSVLVYVRPLGSNRQRYRCEIWKHDGTTVTALDTGGPDRSADELRTHLREHLPRWARRGTAGDRPPMIELVLPEDLLDEAVEQWPRRGRHVVSVLGVNNPVVVRALERFELDPDDPDDEEMLASWQERWDRLAGRRIGIGPATVMTVDCQEQRDESALFAEIALDPGLSTMILPDTPQRRAELRRVLGVGLESGIPIMVWRRNGCGGGAGVAHDECAGFQLGEAVSGALLGVRRNDVPEQILQMRQQAAAKKGPDCGNDVVLFWDDPGRRLNWALMTPPRRDAGG
ncbi:trypsin-like peptidase domain-containing protein [Actinoplanes sp. HUAS TT8]|uniref:VMAP-C domain-containing protein n=1 Tax=Actinoplanes sp. HUAS TT8 TaxID=3447453 RepID=UPI003F51BAD2